MKFSLFIAAATALAAVSAFAAPPSSSGESHHLSKRGFERVKMTFYWVTVQHKKDEGSTALNTLKGKMCLGTASHDWAMKVRCEGTGVLTDGRTINLACDPNHPKNLGMNCFTDITSDRRNAPFGYGNKDNVLVPFFSVANNDHNIKDGQMAYVKQLDGFKLPNGAIHDGCVKKMDEIGTGHTPIDFFALMEVWADDIENRLGSTKIDIDWYTSKCKNPKGANGFGITKFEQIDWQGGRMKGSSGPSYSAAPVSGSSNPARNSHQCDWTEHCFERNTKCKSDDQCCGSSVCLNGRCAAKPANYNSDDDSGDDSDDDSHVCDWPDHCFKLNTKCKKDEQCCGDSYCKNGRCVAKK